MNGADRRPLAPGPTRVPTRRLIAETAWRLFADQGFEQVTVAEVARQAEVAVASVFNYSSTKEDLFYSRLEAFGERLVDAIGARAVGEPVLVAFRRHLLESGGLLAQVEAGDPQALERLRTVHRVIAASPTLLAREQQAIARIADALAVLLAAETGGPADDFRPQVAANALVGVQRALSTTPAVGSCTTRSPPGSPPTSAGWATARSRCSSWAWATTPPDRQVQGITRGQRTRSRNHSQAVAQPSVRWRLGANARKSVLLVHIASAGAWIGIDVVMAVLVFTALGSNDDRTKALSFQALELVAVGPLLVTGLVCLLSGILLGLSSKYGLVRYWW